MWAVCVGGVCVVCDGTFSNVYVCRTAALSAGHVLRGSFAQRVPGKRIKVGVHVDQYSTLVRTFVVQHRGAPRADVVPGG